MQKELAVVIAMSPLASWHEETLADAVTARLRREGVGTIRVARYQVFEGNLETRSLLPVCVFNLSQVPFVTHPVEKGLHAFPPDLRLRVFNRSCDEHDQGSAHRETPPHSFIDGESDTQGSDNIEVIELDADEAEDHMSQDEEQVDEQEDDRQDEQEEDGDQQGGTRVKIPYSASEDKAIMTARSHGMGWGAIALALGTGRSKESVRVRHGRVIRGARGIKRARGRRGQ